MIADSTNQLKMIRSKYDITLIYENLCFWYMFLGTIMFSSNQSPENYHLWYISLIYMIYILKYINTVPIFNSLSSKYTRQGTTIMSDGTNQLKKIKPLPGGRRLSSYLRFYFLLKDNIFHYLHSKLLCFAILSMQLNMKIWECVMIRQLQLLVLIFGIFIPFFLLMNNEQ